jgi:hypothetical protein
MLKMMLGLRAIIKEEEELFRFAFACPHYFVYFLNFLAIIHKDYPFFSDPDYHAAEKAGSGF